MIVYETSYFHLIRALLSASKLPLGLSYLIMFSAHSVITSPLSFQGKDRVLMTQWRNITISSKEEHVLWGILLWSSLEYAICLTKGKRGSHISFIKINSYTCIYLVLFLSCNKNRKLALFS